MENGLGLSAEELMTVFNRMYMDSWGRFQEKASQECAEISAKMAQGEPVDLGEWLMRILEVTVTASRDAALLTIYENNARIAEDLRALGINVPGDGEPAAEETAETEESV